MEKIKIPYITLTEGKTYKSVKQCVSNTIKISGFKDGIIGERVEYAVLANDQYGSTTILIDPWGGHSEYKKYIVYYEREVEANKIEFKGDNNMRTDTNTTMINGTETWYFKNGSSITPIANTTNTIDLTLTESTITTATKTVDSHSYGDYVFNKIVEDTIKMTIPDRKSWNTIPKDFNIWCIKCNPSIVNIKILVPNKVVEVIIYDGKEYTYKQVCKEPDEFNLKYALALAWAKYKSEVVNKQRLTREGLEYYADQYLRYYMDTNKEFDRAIKVYNRWQKEQDKKAAEEAEKKAIIERRQAKNKKRREARRLKAQEEQVNVIAKAINKANEGK